MALEPWMLRMDWREDARPFAVLDLSAWPADLPLDPLPPVPVIAVGDAAHPQAVSVDMIVEPPFTLPALADRIERTPQAAAAIALLLRTGEGLAPEKALAAESFAYAMLQGSCGHRRWSSESRRIPAVPPGQLHMERQGGVLSLVIDRPAARNAIDAAMRDALFDSFRLAALDPTIERIVLTGAGRCFSMGADLGEFGTTTDPATAHAIRMRTLPAKALLPVAGRLHARVQGGCVGSGLELAAFAARLSAAPDAWFQLPEMSMGILPGAGGTVSIPRRIGRQRAALLMLSGRRINAGTALAWGLVDEVSSTDAAGRGT